jgi:hypothetical protein
MSKVIESALDWSRYNEVSPSDEDLIERFNKIGSIAVPTRSSKDRQIHVNNVLNWMRAGKPADTDTPDGQCKKIDKILPKNESRYPEGLGLGARDIASMLDWCRSHSILLSEDGSLPGVKKIGYIPVSFISSENRKDMDSI